MEEINSLDPPQPTDSVDAALFPISDRLWTLMSYLRFHVYILTLSSKLSDERTPPARGESILIYTIVQQAILECNKILELQD